MMENITQQAQQLITRDNLGVPVEVYGTRVSGRIIFGLIFIVFGIAWSLITAIMIDGSLFLLGQSSSPSLDPSSLPSIDPSLSSGVSQFGTLSNAFGIIFPLFGLLFVAIGLKFLLRSILDRHNQTVVCTDGVARVTRKGADAFRWEQVLTVYNRAFMSTSTTQNALGGTSASTTVNYRCAVYCHDGRRFVFYGLNNVADLMERIEVEVARRKAMVGGTGL